MKQKIAILTALALLSAVVWTTVGQDQGKAPKTPREPQRTDDSPDDRPPGPRRGPRGRPPLPPILLALDTNHDGVIDANEIANATAALKSLDKQGRGFLTFEQLLPPPPPPPRDGDFDEAGPGPGGQRRDWGDEGRPEGSRRERPEGRSEERGSRRPEGHGDQRGERPAQPRPPTDE